jgi:hypothetical protein
MNAVRELVIKSKEVQEEIVANGKGMALSPVEFYKRNHLWTEGFFLIKNFFPISKFKIKKNFFKGLISAGRAVGVTATELV